MSRKISLPDENDVMQIVRQLRETNGGIEPTVVSVAREVGLSNGTFWRHFPAIAQSIADARRVAPLNRDAQPARASEDRERSARLQRRVNELENQLEAAAHQIRAITLQNQQLLAELEHPGQVIRGVFGTPGGSVED